MRKGGAKPEPRYNLECRDAVHGFVYLSEEEWAIVDCPTFQRLRDIRQLAMAHLVYPGATHTRFEHSLGCLHLSDLIFEAVRRRVDARECDDFATAFRASDRECERGRKLLRIASLLHDVGHSPFSHSGEHLMPEDGDGRRLAHEDVTAKLIRETEIAERVRSAFPGDTDAVEEVIAVATKPEKAELPRQANTLWYRFLNDIMGGELGSDRMDYLLRDAVHSGQTAGMFDHRKLIDSMMIVRAPEETAEEYRLGLDGAGWLVGEQMIVARYLMYVALYFHKTKRIYEIHLERFLEHWLKQRYGQPTLPALDVPQYVRLTDSAVWAAIYEAASEPDAALHALARPFVDRTHLRLAYELILADNLAPQASRGTLTEFFCNLAGRLSLGQHDTTNDRAASALRDEFETLLNERRPRKWDAPRFAKFRGAVDKYSRSLLGSQTDGCAIDETRHSAMKIFDPDLGNKIWVYVDGKTRYLDDLSEIVRGMPDKIWRGRVYAEWRIRNNVEEFCKKWLADNPAGGGARHVTAGP